jgi:deazaflavin-dependent oxidoreductase (nitroreductase family)
VRWHPAVEGCGAEYQEIRKLTEETLGEQQWLARWASEPYAYLTTTGRRTGRPHRIEIWFAAQDGRVYLLSGGRERSDWVRNLQANAHVTVELGDETHVGVAVSSSQVRSRINVRASCWSANTERATTSTSGAARPSRS